MADIVIEVEDLSKMYRLGEIGTGTLSHDLNRWWAKVRGKEDPFSKLGEVNRRDVKGGDYVWAIKDIGFEVKQGEVLGIVGRNGAGKSTLLKLLSRVTAPTSGHVRAKGRIASLLEVGTGFHPELTGRDNIFLNGAILGMSKSEIRRKFDAIVEFAGVERYIDTPVKRYSSGMYVRLAFAVAAHLESEILIVDEVLAVGDAEFQKKCLGKMSEVSKGEGRSILFVSHNMQAVSTLCNKIVLLQNGQKTFEGPVKEGLNLYLNTIESIEDHKSLEEVLEKKSHDEAVELRDVELSQAQSDGQEFLSDHPITVKYTLRVKKDIFGLRVGFDLIEKSNEITLFRSYHDDCSNSLESVLPGEYQFKAVIPANLLKHGSYLLNVAISIHNVRWIFYDEIKLAFNVSNFEGVNKLYADERPGMIMPAINWTIS